VIIARVIGSVVASQKQASHEGKKILLLQPLDLDDQPLGDVVSTPAWVTAFWQFKRVFPQ